MASLFQPQVTRWLLDGRRVPRGTSGATKQTTTSAKWYARGAPFAKPVPLSTDKAASQVMLAELLRDHERGEAGLRDTVSRANKVPLVEHVADWEQALKDKGTEPKTIRLAVTRVRAVIAALSWTWLADLEAEAATGLLARWRASGEIGRTTSNYYAAALSQFGRWLASGKRKRRTDNVLADVARVNNRVERRHDRRALEEEELGRLLVAARASTRPVRRLNGERRYHLYLSACALGIRAEALGSLLPSSFHLDASPPYVEVSAGKAKNRRLRQQPVTADYAEVMRTWLATLPPDQPLWPGRWYVHGAKVLRVDLAAAGIPYEVAGPDGPLFADFHALRHSYLTIMGQRGVDLRTLQALADHSTPNLTARYTHTTLVGLAAAAEKAGTPGLPTAPTLTLEWVAVAYLGLWMALYGGKAGTSIAPGISEDGQGGARSGP